MVNPYEGNSIWFAPLKLCDAPPILMLLTTKKVQNFPKWCSICDVLCSRPTFPLFRLLWAQCLHGFSQWGFTKNAKCLLCNVCANHVNTSGASHWWCYGCSENGHFEMIKGPKCMSASHAKVRNAWFAWGPKSPHKPTPFCKSVWDLLLSLSWCLQALLGRVCLGRVGTWKIVLMLLLALRPMMVFYDSILWILMSLPLWWSKNFHSENEMLPTIQPPKCLVFMLIGLSCLFVRSWCSKVGLPCFHVSSCLLVCLLSFSMAGAHLFCFRLPLVFECASSQSSNTIHFYFSWGLSPWGGLTCFTLLFNS